VRTSAASQHAQTRTAASTARATAGGAGPGPLFKPELPVNGGPNLNATSHGAARRRTGKPPLSRCALDSEAQASEAITLAAITLAA
jgi:hypothetical protein